MLDLKKDVEAETGRAFSLTIAGGTEAHLIAPELAASGVGVLVLSPRSFPYDWERKRMYVVSAWCDDNMHTDLRCQPTWTAADEGH